MNAIITKEMLCKQAYKLYLAPILFCIFISLFPYCLQNFHPVVTILLLFIPGVYIYSWICFLLHETWHEYVPNAPNKTLFKIYSWLLASDPQIYRICHGSHHAHIHTWKDMEFYPLGYIKNPFLRRCYNFMQFFVGQFFTYLVAFSATSKHPKFRWSGYFISAFIHIILYSCFYMISHFLLHVTTLNIFLSWFLFTLVGGSLQHNSQLLEHWGIIAEGKTWAERNLLSRNLKREGFGRLFLFLTHGDSHEHVLHHTHVGTYTRPFVNALPMPEGSVYINFKDYLKIAWRMII